MALQHVQQANGQVNPPLPRSKRALERFAQRLGEFLLVYWAVIVTVILGALVGFALAIPFFSYFGLDAVANPFCFSLQSVWPQAPTISFYIFVHRARLCRSYFSVT